jgi:hypothetical protein
MGTLRMDCFGLVAVVIHDDEIGGAANKVTLLFPNPETGEGLGLKGHEPLLEISDANSVDWARTTVPPQPATAPLTFSLKDWDIVVRSDDKPPTQTVTFPRERQDPADPAGIRTWDRPDRFLDVKTICSGDALKDEFFGKPDSGAIPAELMGRLTIDSGLLHTGSLLNGSFEHWRFIDEEDDHKEVHTQDAAGQFSTVFFADQVVVFEFTPLRGGAEKKRLTLKCPGTTAIQSTLTHVCGDNCGDHKGKHVKMYYQMMQQPARTPEPVFQFSDTGYCPPGRFMRATRTSLVGNGSK